MDTRKDPQYRPIEIIRLYTRHDQVSTHLISYVDVSTSHSHYSHPTTMFNHSDNICLHHIASLGSIPTSQWSIDSSNFDQTSMPTCPPFACFLPWYQPTSNYHSYHMGNPFIHGYSHMGYTFEGLTGRTSTNKIRGQYFCLTHSAQEMYPEPHPSMEKGVEEVNEGFPPLFYLGLQVGYVH